MPSSTKHSSLNRVLSDLSNVEQVSTVSDHHSEKTPAGVVSNTTVVLSNNAASEDVANADDDEKSGNNCEDETVATQNAADEIKQTAVEKVETNCTESGQTAIDDTTVHNSSTTTITSDNLPAAANLATSSKSMTSITSSVEIAATKSHPKINNQTQHKNVDRMFFIEDIVHDEIGARIDFSRSSSISFQDGEFNLLYKQPYNNTDVNSRRNSTASMNLLSSSVESFSIGKTFDDSSKDKFNTGSNGPNTSSSTEFNVQKGVAVLEYQDNYYQGCAEKNEEEPKILGKKVSEHRNLNVNMNNSGGGMDISKSRLDISTRIENDYYCNNRDALSFNGQDTAMGTLDDSQPDNIVTGITGNAFTYSGSNSSSSSATGFVSQKSNAVQAAQKNNTKINITPASASPLQPTRIALDNLQAASPSDLHNLQQNTCSSNMNSRAVGSSSSNPMTISNRQIEKKLFSSEKKSSNHHNSSANGIKRTPVMQKKYHFGSGENFRCINSEKNDEPDHDGTSHVTAVAGITHGTNGATTSDHANTNGSTTKNSYINTYDVMMMVATPMEEKKRPELRSEILRNDDESLPNNSTSISRTGLPIVKKVLDDESFTHCNVTEALGIDRQGSAGSTRTLASNSTFPDASFPVSAGKFRASSFSRPDDKFIHDRIDDDMCIMSVSPESAKRDMAGVVGVVNSCDQKQQCPIDNSGEERSVVQENIPANHQVLERTGRRRGRFRNVATINTNCSPLGINYDSNPQSRKNSLPINSIERTYSNQLSASKLLAREGKIDRLFDSSIKHATGKTFAVTSAVTTPAVHGGPPTKGRHLDFCPPQESISSTKTPIRVANNVRTGTNNDISAAVITTPTFDRSMIHDGVNGASPIPNLEQNVLAPFTPFNGDQTIVLSPLGLDISNNDHDDARTGTTPPGPPQQMKLTEDSLNYIDSVNSHLKLCKKDSVTILAGSAATAAPVTNANGELLPTINPAPINYNQFVDEDIRDVVPEASSHEFRTENLDAVPPVPPPYMNSATGEEFHPRTFSINPDVCYSPPSPGEEHRTAKSRYANSKQTLRKQASIPWSGVFRNSQISSSTSKLNRNGTESGTNSLANSACKMYDKKNLSHSNISSAVKSTEKCSIDRTDRRRFTPAEKVKGAVIHHGLPTNMNSTTPIFYNNFKANQRELSSKNSDGDGLGSTSQNNTFNSIGGKALMKPRPGLSVDTYGTTQQMGSGTFNMGSGFDSANYDYPLNIGSSGCTSALFASSTYVTPSKDYQYVADGFSGSGRNGGINGNFNNATTISGNNGGGGFLKKENSRPSSTQKLINSSTGQFQSMNSTNNPVQIPKQNENIDTNYLQRLISSSSHAGSSSSSSHTGTNNNSNSVQRDFSNNANANNTTGGIVSRVNSNNFINSNNEGGVSNNAASKKLFPTGSISNQINDSLTKKTAKLMSMDSIAAEEIDFQISGFPVSADVSPNNFEANKLKKDHFKKVDIDRDQQFGRDQFGKDVSKRLLISSPCTTNEDDESSLMMENDVMLGERPPLNTMQQNIAGGRASTSGTMVLTSMDDSVKMKQHRDHLAAAAAAAGTDRARGARTPRPRNKKGAFVFDSDKETSSIASGHPAARGVDSSRLVEAGRDFHASESRKVTNTMNENAVMPASSQTIKTRSRHSKGGTCGSSFDLSHITACSPQTSAALFRALGAARLDEPEKSLSGHCTQDAIAVAVLADGNFQPSSTSSTARRIMTGRDDSRGNSSECVEMDVKSRRPRMIDDDCEHRPSATTAALEETPTTAELQRRIVEASPTEVHVSSSTEANVLIQAGKGNQCNTAIVNPLDQTPGIPLIPGADSGASSIMETANDNYDSGLNSVTLREKQNVPRKNYETPQRSRPLSLETEERLMIEVSPVGRIAAAAAAGSISNSKISNCKAKICPSAPCKPTKKIPRHHDIAPSRDMMMSANIGRRTSVQSDTSNGGITGTYNYADQAKNSTYNIGIVTPSNHDDRGLTTTAESLNKNFQQCQTAKIGQRVAVDRSHSAMLSPSDCNSTPAIRKESDHHAKTAQQIVVNDNDAKRSESMEELAFLEQQLLQEGNKNNFGSAATVSQHSSMLTSSQMPSQITQMQTHQATVLTSNSSSTNNVNTYTGNLNTLQIPGNQHSTKSVSQRGKTTNNKTFCITASDMAVSKLISQESYYQSDNEFIQCEGDLANLCNDIYGSSHSMLGGSIGSNIANSNNNINTYCNSQQFAQSDSHPTAAPRVNAQHSQQHDSSQATIHQASPSGLLMKNNISSQFPAKRASEIRKSRSLRPSVVQIPEEPNCFHDVVTDSNVALDSLHQSESQTKSKNNSRSHGSSGSSVLNSNIFNESGVLIDGSALFNASRNTISDQHVNTRLDSMSSMNISRDEMPRESRERNKGERTAAPDDRIHDNDVDNGANLKRKSTTSSIHVRRRISYDGLLSSNYCEDSSTCAENDACENEVRESLRIARKCSRLSDDEVNADSVCEKNARSNVPLISSDKNVQSDVNMHIANVASPMKTRRLFAQNSTNALPDNNPAGSRKVESHVSTTTKNVLPPSQIPIDASNPTSQLQKLPLNNNTNDITHATTAAAAAAAALSQHQPNETALNNANRVSITTAVNSASPSNSCTLNYDEGYTTPVDRRTVTEKIKHRFYDDTDNQKQDLNADSRDTAMAVNGRANANGKAALNSKSGKTGGVNAGANSQSGNNANGSTSPAAAMSLRRDFRNIETIGEGTFSVVYKAQYVVDEMWYAIKKIRKRILIKQSDVVGRSHHAAPTSSAATGATAATSAKANSTSCRQHGGLHQQQQQRQQNQVTMSHNATNDVNRRKSDLTGKSTSSLHNNSSSSSSSTNLLSARSVHTARSTNDPVSEQSLQQGHRSCDNSAVSVVSTAGENLTNCSMLRESHEERAYQYQSSDGIIQGGDATSAYTAAFSQQHLHNNKTSHNNTESSGIGTVVPKATSQKGPSTHHNCGVSCISTTATSPRVIHNPRGGDCRDGSTTRTSSAYYIANQNSRNNFGILDSRDSSNGMEEMKMAHAGLLRLTRKDNDAPSSGGTAGGVIEGGDSGGGVESRIAGDIEAQCTSGDHNGVHVVSPRSNRNSSNMGVANDNTTTSAKSANRSRILVSQNGPGTTGPSGVGGPQFYGVGHLGGLKEHVSGNGSRFNRVLNEARTLAKLVSSPYIVRYLNLVIWRFWCYSSLIMIICMTAWHWVVVSCRLM